MRLRCAICRGTTAVENLHYVVDGVPGESSYPSILVNFNELQRHYKEAWENEDGNLLDAIENGVVKSVNGKLCFIPRRAKLSDPWQRQ